MFASCPFLRVAPRRCAGFTWIELLAVIAVVAILALMAVPGLQDTALKKQVKEGMGLASVATLGVQAAYSASGEMPANNAAAGIPVSTKIVGSMVKEVTVEGGAVTITYGNNASKALDGKHLTLRPAVVAGEPVVPIAWICAKVAVPKGMELRGNDKTDIQSSWLPVDCRGPETK
jgi:type IV pilus assembly protein PilA